MAKMRGIKPEYWTDEDIVDLSIPARLLFIGLWNYACDNGHLPDKSKQIKMRLLPSDDVNVAELLRELAAKGRIERENGWITIPKFAHHQKPNKRYWLTCEMPGCSRLDADSQPETPVAQVRPSLHNGEQEGASADGDGDGDGDGEVMVKVKSARKRALPEDFKPSREHVDLATELSVDLRAEWPQFVDHHRSKGSLMKDWDAALRTWIRNAAKFRKGPPPPLPLRVVTGPSRDDVR